MCAPLVSVIMPSFGSERHIEESINSIQQQTYENWELVVADGGSKDRTLEIVQRFAASDTRIRLLSNKYDDGPSHARAMAIRTSHGEYIAFLDADDLWDKFKLERQIEFMLRTGSQFTYTKYRKISDDGALKSGILSARRNYSYNKALLMRGIGTLTVCISRELLSEEVINKNNGNHGEDYLWWCLILKSGIRANLLDSSLAFYRNNSDGLSRSFIKHMQHVWISYRDHLNVPIIFRFICFICYPVDVVFRSILLKFRV